MSINSEINKSTYNLIARQYAKSHGVELVWRDELDKFIGYLNKPKLVLDLGSGHGDESVYLAINLQETKFIGLDFSSEMTKISKSKSDKVKFDTKDIVTYKPRGKVDGIWARATLHHLNQNELNQLFENISEYANKGMVLGMVNKYGNEEEIEAVKKYGSHIRRYFNYFDEKKVLDICEKFGYELLEQYEKIDGGNKFLVSFLKKI